MLGSPGAAVVGGALMLVDDYQGIGQVPIDLHAADVDIWLGGPLKWLCGGPGGCFLYVAPGIRERYAPAQMAMLDSER